MTGPPLKFSNAPYWISGALDLSQPSPLNELADQSVRLVLDAGQGGIGFSQDFELFTVIQPENSGVTSRELLTPNYDHGWLVVAGHFHNGTGATANCRAFLRKMGTTTQASHIFTSAVGNGAPLALIAPGSRLWIPPAWGLYLDPPATGAGQTMSLTCIATRIPRGFYP